MSKHRVVHVTDLQPFGADLHRPECVVIGGAGEVYVPDWRGGVTTIAADGSQETRLARSALAMRPNGIALAENGASLLANLGDDGGVWRLRRDGGLEPFLLEVDGVPVP